MEHVGPNLTVVWLVEKLNGSDPKTPLAARDGVNRMLPMPDI